MTLKKIETGKASAGATTTKTAGASGATTLNTAAATSAMEALYTATPEDTIAAIERVTAGGSTLQAFGGATAGFESALEATPQTSIDAIQRLQAATTTAAARESATTVQQETAAQGILETGAFTTLSERVGDATLQILVGYGKDEFGIHNYNDLQWVSVYVDSNDDIVTAEDVTLSNGQTLYMGSQEGVIQVALNTTEVLCRLLQDDDADGNYDLTMFDAYFIMELSSGTVTVTTHAFMMESWSPTAESIDLSVQTLALTDDYGSSDRTATGAYNRVMDLSDEMKKYELYSMQTRGTDLGMGRYQEERLLWSGSELWDDVVSGVSDTWSDFLSMAQSTFDAIDGYYRSLSTDGSSSYLLYDGTQYWRADAAALLMELGTLWMELIRLAWPNVQANGGGSSGWG